jgi:hypothetical protein
MREIRTSGLMSGDGKRGGAASVSTRAHPRLYPCSPAFSARLKSCPDTTRNTISTDSRFWENYVALGNLACRRLQPARRRALRSGRPLKRAAARNGRPTLALSSSVRMATSFITRLIQTAPQLRQARASRERWMTSNDIVLKSQPRATALPRAFRSGSRIRAPS